MSSLYASLNIGLTGLQSNQAALSVVGHNIANVQTPNYSRQRAVMGSKGAQPFGNLEFGQGVSLDVIMGVRDRFLDAQITRASSKKAGSDTRYQMLEGIASVFLDSGTDADLSTQVQKVFQGFQDVATKPEDLAARTGLLGAAQTLADGIRSRWQLLNDQRVSANQNLAQMVPEINSITAEIAKLNARIGSEITPGAENDARDQRQGLANRLSELVGVQVFEDTHQQLQITLDNGAAVLVSGGRSYDMRVSPPDPALDGFSRVEMVMGGSVVVDVTGNVKEGRMGALLELRDVTLPGFQRQLDQLASGIGGQVNLLHRNGYALDGTTTGLNFFTGLAPVGANGLPTTVAGAAKSLKVNTVLVGDPRLVGAADTAGAVGNNGIARQLAALQSKANTVDTNNDGVGDSGPFSTTVGTLMASVGTTVQGLMSRSTGDENLMIALQNQRNRLSGVDLDEEAMQMIAFQRGYQASARFVSVINQLTDQLVNQLGR